MWDATPHFEISQNQFEGYCIYNVLIIWFLFIRLIVIYNVKLVICELVGLVFVSIDFLNFFC